MLSPASSNDSPELDEECKSLVSTIQSFSAEAEASFSSSASSALDSAANTIPSFSTDAKAPYSQTALALKPAACVEEASPSRTSELFGYGFEEDDKTREQDEERSIGSTGGSFENTLQSFPETERSFRSTSSALAASSEYATSSGGSSPASASARSSDLLLEPMSWSRGKVKASSSEPRFVSLTEMEDAWRKDSSTHRGIGDMDHCWYDWGTKNWKDVDEEFQNTSMGYPRSDSTRDWYCRDASMQDIGVSRKPYDPHRDAESSWTKAWRTRSDPFLPTISRATSRRPSPMSSIPVGAIGVDSGRSKRDEALEQIAQRRPAGRKTNCDAPAKFRGLDRRFHEGRPLTASCSQPDLVGRSQIDLVAFQKQQQSTRPAGVPTGCDSGAQHWPAWMRNPPNLPHLR